MKAIWNFIKDENGMEIVEYAVIGAMIIVGTIATILLVRGEVVRIFGLIQQQLATAPGAGS